MAERVNFTAWSTMKIPMFLQSKLGKLSFEIIKLKFGDFGYLMVAAMQIGENNLYLMLQFLMDVKLYISYRHNGFRTIFDEIFHGALDKPFKDARSTLADTTLLLLP